MISMYVCHDADMYTRREASFASAKEPYLDMEEGKNTCLKFPDISVDSYVKPLDICYMWVSSL